MDGEGGWVEPAAIVEIPEKAEIESEWVEWQTGLVEQQEYAVIDPRQIIEDEDDHANYEWLHDPSFIGSIVRGGVVTQNDVITRIRHSHWAPATARPEAALFYIRLDIAELWNCLAPNPAI